MTYLASNGPLSGLRLGLFVSVVVGWLSLAAIGRSMAGEAANTDRETTSSPGDTKAITTSNAHAVLPKATEVFAQAVAEADKIPKLDERTNELIRIAEAQAQAGQKEQARRTFGEAFAIARQHDQALPKDNRERDRSLRTIAESQIEAGFLSDAIATSERIEGSSELASVVERIIPAQIKTGQLDAAIANARRCELNRDRHLCDIAVAQAKLGQKEQSRKTFAEAVAVVKSCEKNSASRPDVGNYYADIASAEIEAGLLEDAIALANSMASVPILCDIAVAQAKRVQTDQAIETFHAASASAARVTDRHTQFDLVLGIATAQANANMTADAKESFQQATAIAAEDDLNMRWQLFLWVAHEQAQAKMTADASATIQKASELIEQAKLKTPQWWSGDSLLRLAEAQLMVGMRKEATANFAAALADAALVTDSLWGRNGAGFAVAGKEWKAHLYADTLTALQTINVSDPKTAELVHVLQAWILADMGRFDEALAKSRQVSSEIHRAGCLFYVATREFDAGKADSARQLVEEAIAICKIADRNQHWISGAFGLGRDFDDECFEQLRAFLKADSIPAMITWVVVAYAKTGHFSEIPAIIHSLKTEDRQLDAWHKSLAEISKMRIASQDADEVAAMIAEAKADLGKLTRGRAKAEMLACIAALEAKTGQAESARHAFSDALATAQTIRRPGDRSEEWLPGVVETETRSGFLAEAAESCRVITESLRKERLLKEIAAAQRDVALKDKLQEALSGHAVESSFADDPKFKSEWAKSLAKAGRFPEAIALARQLSDGDQIAQLFSEIVARLKRVKDTKQLRAVVAEWTTIASQLEDLSGLERNLHEIVPYQAELGMGEEMRRSFEVRLNAAKKREPECVDDCRIFGVRVARIEHGPPVGDIAIDQAKYGSLVDACATIRMLKEGQSSVIREVLANCREEKPPRAGIRQVFAEVLAVARQCSGEHKVDVFLEVANLQAKAGLQEEANATLDELLAMVRESREFVVRGFVFSMVSGRSRDTCESIKDRVRFILQEAVAVAAGLKDERDRGHALGWIASQQAKAGFVGEAVETHRRIKSTEWPTERAGQVAKIACYAKGEQAATLLDDAFTAVVAGSGSDSIQKPGSDSIKNQGIAILIRVAVEIGAFSKASEISQYWRSRQPGNRIAVLCFVAAAQCRTGQKEDARQLLAQAAAEASAMNDGSTRVVENEPKSDLLPGGGKIGTRAAALREIAVVLAELEKTAF